MIIRSITCALLVLAPAAAQAKCEFFGDWDYGTRKYVSLEAGECMIFAESENGANGMCSTHQGPTSANYEFGMETSSFRATNGEAIWVKTYNGDSPVVQNFWQAEARLGPDLNDRIVAVSCQ